jgi:YVTN family beta-propeller protein
VIYDVGGSTNHVLLLDARTGALRARFPRSPASVSVTVDERASRAYVVDMDAGSVMVLDDRTGAVLATVDVRGRPALSPNNGDYSPFPVVVDDRSGHAFVASHDGHSVTMLDSHTGRLVQTIALAQDAELTGIAVDEQRSRVVVGAVYTVASERAGRPGLVTILDARTGAILQTARP